MASVPGPLRDPFEQPTSAHAATLPPSGRSRVALARTDRVVGARSLADTGHTRRDAS